MEIPDWHKVRNRANVVGLLEEAIDNCDSFDDYRDVYETKGMVWDLNKAASVSLDYIQNHLISRTDALNSVSTLVDNALKNQDISRLGYKNVLYRIREFLTGQENPLDGIMPRCTNCSDLNELGEQACYDCSYLHETVET